MTVATMCSLAWRNGTVRLREVVPWVSDRPLAGHDDAEPGVIRRRHRKPLTSPRPAVCGGGHIMPARASLAAGESPIAFGWCLGAQSNPPTPEPKPGTDGHPRLQSKAPIWARRQAENSTE